MAGGRSAALAAGNWGVGLLHFQTYTSPPSAAHFCLSSRRHAPPGCGTRCGAGHLRACRAQRPRQAAVQVGACWTGSRLDLTSAAKVLQAAGSSSQCPAWKVWLACTAATAALHGMWHVPPNCCRPSLPPHPNRLEVPSTPGEAQLEFTIGEEGAFVLQVKVRLRFQRAGHTIIRWPSCLLWGVMSHNPWVMRAP